MMRRRAEPGETGCGDAGQVEKGGPGRDSVGHFTGRPGDNYAFAVFVGTGASDHRRIKEEDE